MTVDGNSIPPENPGGSSPSDDFAGRKDLEDLKRAYAASSQEGHRLAAEVQQLRQQMQQQFRPEIQQRPPDPYRELTDVGLFEPVRALVANEITRAFEPIAERIKSQAEARTQMLSRYGQEFGKYEPEVAQYLQSDPVVNQRYNAIFNSHPSEGPIAAAEYAYLTFGESRRRAQPPASPNGGDRDGQAQASVPTTRGGGGGRNPGDGQRDRVSRALEAYQKNPSRQNAEAYAKARYGQAIPDAFLYGGGG